MNDFGENRDYFSTSLKDPVKLRLNANNSDDYPCLHIPELFRACCLKYAQRPALAYPSNGPKSVKSLVPEWKFITYTQYEANVHQTALLLLHLGVAAHSSVAILARNCPEWFYIELATLRIGGVVIGLYPSSSADGVRHVLAMADVSVCFVDNVAQMAKIREVQSTLPKLHTVVQLNGVDVEPSSQSTSNPSSSLCCYRWLDLFECVYEQQLHQQVLQRENNVAANDCAMLIFTSGTMGMPKGVMLTHDAVTYDTRAVAKLLASKTCCGYETFISYLPLNHIAAQVFDVFLGLELGGCIYFPSGDVLRSGLQTALKAIEPTLFFGVPRIFEKLEEHIKQLVTQTTTWSVRYNLPMARKLMLDYHLQRTKYFSDSLKYWLAAMGLRTFKASLGLEKCKYLFVGGAPVSENLKRFFLELNLPLTEVFGMSETSGAVTLNFDYSKLNTVGKPIGDMMIKVSSPSDSGEGEICLHGRTIFMGYLKEPEKTVATLTSDGWLRTGDWGYLDKEGSLAISGRIKDLIITSGGENIPPSRIENTIKGQLTCISNAVVIGDKRKYLTVLLTLKTKIDQRTGELVDEFTEETIDWFQSIDLSGISRPSELCSNRNNTHFNQQIEEMRNAILAAIWKGIEQSNQLALSSAQRIQYFTVLPNDFSIASGELGDTLKIKRLFILTKYSDIIDAMYKPGFRNQFLLK